MGILSSFRRFRWEWHGQVLPFLYLWRGLQQL